MYNMYMYWNTAGRSIYYLFTHLGLDELTLRSLGDADEDEDGSVSATVDKPEEDDSNNSDSAPVKTWREMLVTLLRPR